jgi:hypothetical protein
MYKNKIPLMAQEYLGYHLGLLLPDEDRSLFWKTRSGNKPEAGWGTQIEKKQFSPNIVFPRLDIPLKMVLHPGNKFTEDTLLNFLIKSEKGDRDLLLCFDNGALTNSKKHGGHVCLFDRVDAKHKSVRLIDPSSNQPKWRLVKIEDLLRGISYRRNKSAGIWEFSLNK